MSDAISILVDFSNGVTKSFAQVPLSGRMSVTQALAAAAMIAPGLVYEFDAGFVDRGGTERRYDQFGGRNWRDRGLRMGRLAERPGNRRVLSQITGYVSIALLQGDSNGSHILQRPTFSTRHDPPKRSLVSRVCS